MTLLNTVKNFLFPNRLSSNEWLGEYYYGEMYAEHLQNEANPFKLYLNFENENIKGKIYELINNEPKTMPIIGHFDGKNISFKEHRTEHWVTEDDRSITISDMPQIVSYKGVFDSHSNTFSGNWEISQTYYASSSAVQQEQLDWSGTWRIFKE